MRQKLPAANDIFEQWQMLKLPTDEIQIVARRKELLYVMDLILVDLKQSLR